jgi:hypothetical protein
VNPWTFPDAVVEEVFQLVPEPLEPSLDLLKPSYQPHRRLPVEASGGLRGEHGERSSEVLKLVLAVHHVRTYVRRGGSATGSQRRIPV